MIPINNIPALNQDSFNSFTNVKIARECQLKAFSSLIADDVKKGIASMITASGKTLVEIALINRSFYLGNLKNCIVTESIMLGQQIALDYLENCHSDVKVILFNSDNIDAITSYGGWLSDTKDISADDHKELSNKERSELKAEYNEYKCEESAEFELFESKIKAKNSIISTTNIKDIPTDGKFVIISTYHSFSKLKNVGFGTTVFDEAHKSTAPKVTKALKSLKSEYKYFFTSTPTGDVEMKTGMGNQEIYGEIAYELKYVDAVNQNIIVPVVLTSLVNEEFDNDFKNTKTDSAALKFTRNVIQQEIGSTFKNPKIVINVSRIKQAKYTFDNLVIEKHEINLYVVASGCYYKYDHVADKVISYPNKAKVIEAVHKESGPFCLINIAMLNVGIDIPALTTLGILSTTSSTKLLQSIGRILRVMNADKNKKWSFHKINHDMEKPFAKLYFNESGSNKEENIRTFNKSMKFLLAAYGTLLHCFDSTKSSKTGKKLPKLITDPELLKSDFSNALYECLIKPGMVYDIGNAKNASDLFKYFAQS